MKSVERMIDSALVICKTKTALARVLGDTPQTLYNYEVGLRHMPAKKLMQLATIAGVNPVLELGRYEAEWVTKKTDVAHVGIAAAGFSLAVWFLAHGADASASQYPSVRYDICTLCAIAVAYLQRFSKTTLAAWQGWDWVKRSLPTAA